MCLFSAHRGGIKRRAFAVRRFPTLATATNREDGARNGFEKGRKDACHIQRFSASHWFLWAAERGQIEPAERGHSPECVHRIGGSGHDHGSGGEADGTAPDW